MESENHQRSARTTASRQELDNADTRIDWASRTNDGRIQLAGIETHPSRLHVKPPIERQPFLIGDTVADLHGRSTLRGPDNRLGYLSRRPG